ncbi:MAG TPA: peptidylprolyl isomerase [Polyangiaceae bacterium]|nr:peptidylprolyl isomerase [Polyangiaceae bacterium]
MRSSRLPLILTVLATFAIAPACDKQSEEPSRAAAAPSQTEAPKATATVPVATAQPTVAAAPEQSAAPVPPALLKPADAKEKAPAKYKVKFATTKGDFVVEVSRDWAPLGADRFYNLVKIGFFTDVAFFRVVENFVVQFGLHGSPEVNTVWRQAQIKDDPQTKQSNLKGTLTFAKAGPDTRTTQLFVNFKDNDRLDKMGFPPFGKVVEGMSVIESINKEYGESPNQAQIQSQGNAYLKANFPRLDYVKSATIVK